MINYIKNNVKRGLDRFKNSFLLSDDLPFTEIFPVDVINDIVENTPSKRSTVFAPLVTLKAFFLQVLGDDGSCKHAVAGVLIDRLSEGKSANTINTGPYTKARQRLPLKQLESAVTAVGKGLHQKMPKAWRWMGYNVVMADGMTVLMPDTPANQAEFPQQQNQKQGLGFPIMRIVALISLAAGSLIAYSYGPYEGKGTGETSLLSQLFGHLTAGDLLLADRYYCTFAICALMQACGVPVLFQMHARKKVDLNLGVSLGPKDHLSEWVKPKLRPVWMSIEDYAALPDKITVREFSVKGKVYLTTLIDSKLYNKQDLVILYKNRWKIELAFRTIKTDMNMEMLRCKNPDNVKKEIAVYLLAYNIIRGNLAQAASLYQKVPNQLSFKSAVQLITQATGQLLSWTGVRLIKAILALLKAISSTAIGRQKRKGQPRVIKRRPKSYPLMNVPRNRYC